jgi:ketosteroid isomerase-like protein
MERSVSGFYPYGVAMSELDYFVAQTVERHCRAVTGVRNGVPTAFIQQLSRNDPVTLFPASQPSQTGWGGVSRAIQRVASVYSSSDPVQFDVTAAALSGDLAYIVGHERAASSISGGAHEDLDLRVTQVYRREHGEWKLVHRHADPGLGSGGSEHLRQQMRNHQS